MKQHTMSSFNAHLAMGNVTRQTNGLPDGGRTFSWSEAVAKKAKGRRTKR